MLKAIKAMVADDCDEVNTPLTYALFLEYTLDQYKLYCVHIYTPTNITQVAIGVVYTLPQILCKWPVILLAKSESLVAIGVVY